MKKNTKSIFHLLHHGLFPYPLSHTFMCRSKTEVIISHANEPMLWHSDSSSLWPGIDPRLQLQSENLHLQHHRLPCSAPSNTTGQRQKHCKTTALLKRNTATCRREIYQLPLSVLFFRKIKLASCVSTTFDIYSAIYLLLQDNPTGSTWG